MTSLALVPCMCEVHVWACIFACITKSLYAVCFKAKVKKQHVSFSPKASTESCSDHMQKKESKSGAGGAKRARRSRVGVDAPHLQTWNGPRQICKYTHFCMSLDWSCMSERFIGRETRGKVIPASVKNSQLTHVGVSFTRLRRINSKKIRTGYF